MCRCWLFFFFCFVYQIKKATAKPWNSQWTVELQTNASTVHCFLSGLSKGSAASYASLLSNIPLFLVKSHFYKCFLQMLGFCFFLFVILVIRKKPERNQIPERAVTQLCFLPLTFCSPFYLWEPPPFSSNECLSLVLTSRSIGAGLALLPEDLGVGRDSQRRKKRLSSRGFERHCSAQVRVPLSSVMLEIKQRCLCFFAFDTPFCCTHTFKMRCYTRSQILCPLY